MKIDVRPLLQRLVLGALPFGVSACRPCDIKPDQVFETTIAVLDDEYEFLQPGMLRLDPHNRAPDGGEGLRRPLSAEARARYDECINPLASCRSFCETVAAEWWTEGLELHACRPVENGTDRPDILVSGLGTNAVCGRRPTGLLPMARPTAHNPLGLSLAASAHLEAAAVTAFRRLARDLQVHGAPSMLCHAARRSARDEARHARLVGRLARAWGTRPPVVRVPPARTQTLFGLAAENAVEGCVRETFGALVARWQSATATSLAVRHAARSIAPDEAEHANLAWQIDAWVGSRLSAGERRRLRGLRADAVATLHGEWSQPLPAELREPLGFPDQATALRLLAGLDEQLFQSPG